MKGEELWVTAFSPGDALRGTVETLKEVAITPLASQVFIGINPRAFRLLLMLV